ncbi:MAG: hypothetical protein GF308_02230 [Candidatus Heimdallarchaeota archaeon]|nr:hypothetical protein [Candidatus Heimdallarchaeota archaeon]
MSLCELDNHYNISEMRKKTVICSKGSKIGNIQDIVVNNQYQLESFIIGGSFWEEFRERLGIIKDIDPVVPVNNVAEITKNEIILNLPKEELPHKLEEGVISPTAITYNLLRRKKVIDSKGKTIGKIVNLVILPCAEIAFIIGGPRLEEIAESIGFKENWDLLLPIKYIKSVDDETITINVSQDKLKVTLDNRLIEDEKVKDYLDSLQTKGSAEMRALKQIGFGVSDISKPPL